MAHTRRQGERSLQNTLDHLSRLYKSNNIEQGRMARAGVKQQWVMVTGSEGECGIADNGSGALPPESSQAGTQVISRIQKMIDQPLFEVAAIGIQSGNLLDRSLGVAAMSALSQHFLSCSAVRKRGYFSECWRAGDPFVLQHPMMSRFVTMDDVVAIVGNGSGLGLRELRGMCRELHVIDAGSPDMFRTLIIDSSTAGYPRDIAVHSWKQNPDLLRKADVVFINAVSLIDRTFEDLVQDTAHARMVGLFGLSGSLIPDAFFSQGLDFISSYRITDPCGFADAMAKEHDVESAFRTEQKQYLMMNPSQ
jgi:uncharacterized protein (DUF4213/DUF364 family)